MNNSYWALNGSYFREYNGLPEDSIEKLDYKGEINGIKIFTSNKIPVGTLRYYQNNKCVAEIIGIKTTSSQTKSVEVTGSTPVFSSLKVAQW